MTLKSELGDIEKKQKANNMKKIRLGEGLPDLGIEANVLSRNDDVSARHNVDVIEAFENKLSNFLGRLFRIKHVFDSSCRARNVFIREPDVFKFYFRLDPRVGSWRINTFVISAFVIHSGRMSQERALLRFILEYSKSIGFNQIGLENIHLDENMQAFGTRFGFQSFGDCSNWIANVDDLLDELNAASK